MRGRFAVIRTSQSAPRFGIEEEFLLLDAETGLPRDMATEMIAALPHLRAENEFFESQLETATPVCEVASEAADGLSEFRSAASRAAENLGVVLSGTGLPPIGDSEPGTVTKKSRYLAVSDQMRHIVSRYYSTGTHVHVEVPSRAVGIDVLARMARWSATFVALTANSPLRMGEHTGYASWRFLTTLQWPTAGYPPYFNNVSEYEGTVGWYVSTGILLDSGLVNWSIRLSETYPTIELRTADAQLNPHDTLAFAMMVRALVARCIAECESASERVDPPLERVKAAHWIAAHNGLGSTLVDPVTTDSVAAWDVVDAMREHIAVELEAAGDVELVDAYLGRRRRLGDPATIQSERFRESGISGLLDLYREGSR